MGKKVETSELENFEGMENELRNEVIDQKDGEAVRRKYVISSKGKEVVFKVDVLTRKEYNRDEKYFRVFLGQHPKLYKVDEGNKILLDVLDKNTQFDGVLFEGNREDGSSYIGLEVRMDDGYKIQYQVRSAKGPVSGFWFSSGDRKALEIMGYLNLVEVAA